MDMVQADATACQPRYSVLERGRHCYVLEAGEMKAGPYPKATAKRIARYLNGHIPDGPGWDRLLEAVGLGGEA